MVKGGWGTQLYAVVQIIKFRFCITKYITYLANEALKKKIYSSLRSRWNDWWSKNGRMLINIESGWWLYKRFIIHIPFPLKCSIIKLFFFKSEKEPLGCSDFKAQALFTSHFASKKKKNSKYIQTQEDNSIPREIQKRGTNPQEGGLCSQSELEQNFTTAKGLHLIEGAPMPCPSFAFLSSLSITFWLER